VSTFSLIDAEKATYPVVMLCRILGVSKKSGYYALGEIDHFLGELGRTPSSLRRSARSIAGAASLTATRGYMPSCVRSE
jgi:hypothetical protein